jgi:Fe2+ transport system protein FeoA
MNFRFIGEPMTLADYRKGDRGTIAKIEGEPQFRKRIMEMGFVKGAQVQVVKYAPLADPVELLIKGYHLTLRKDQAAAILMSEPVLDR